MSIVNLQVKGKVKKLQLAGSFPLNLQEKTATENGEVTADEGYDGLSKVTVNVAGSGSSEALDAELDEQEALIAELKEILERKGTGRKEEWLNDGNTHIWITLPESRISPCLGVCPNGTVTVDWGDGTEPDVLTGTSTFTVKWTPSHEYGKAGDYVITLSCDGEMGLAGSGTTYGGAYILRHTTGADKQNITYQNAIKKVELGDTVIALDYGAFHTCYSMEALNIPESVVRVGGDAFRNCYSLQSVSISSCENISGSTNFYHCHTLKHAELPVGMTAIGSYAFEQCYCLTAIDIPESVTSINNDAFSHCTSLLSVIIPKGVTRIESNTFKNCYSVEYYDFTRHTAVPVLASTDAFYAIAPTCEIRVPASLYDEWISATNWTTYAASIVVA